MARRKRTRSTKSVKIDEVAHRRLPQLQDALAELALPSYVDDMEIMSALVLFTTPEQLAGMLAGYWRSTGRLDPATDEPTEAEDPPDDG